jgi:NADP-dependent 3-hydroxy acid dehydrogenase YdfG
MKQVALITDASTPLGDQLVRRYLSEGYSVIATCSGGATIGTPVVSEEEDLLVIEWNRRSPISAQNVSLAALNRFDRIDQTLLLLTPALEQKLLQETAAETIDRAVDVWIKGSLFLIRTILVLYGQRQGGTLALVNHTSQAPSAVPPPLESALRGSFRATAEAIFAGIGQQNVFVTGFESHSARVEELADFIFDTMNGKAIRTTGKWYRFPPRSGILSALSPR